MRGDPVAGCETQTSTIISSKSIIGNIILDHTATILITLVSGITISFMISIVSRIM